MPSLALSVSQRKDADLIFFLHWLGNILLTLLGNWAILFPGRDPWTLWVSMCAHVSVGGHAFVGEHVCTSGGGVPLWVSMCAHVCRGHACVGEHVCTCVCGGMLLSNSFSLKEALKEKLNNSFSLIKFIKLLSSFDLMGFLDLKVISKFFPDNVKKEKNDVIVYVGSGDVLYLFHAIQIVSREFFRFKKKSQKSNLTTHLPHSLTDLKVKGFLSQRKKCKAAPNE